MSLNRILKYINYLILVLLLAAVVLVYWFAWRVLPRTSGALKAPVSAPVTVARDALGVPHIQGATADDVHFAQGFVIAQDRLFQLEMARRHGAGELAEVLGPALIESDLESRRLRMRRLAESITRELTQEDRRPIAAYARGINFFLETHHDRLPLEFRLLGFDPAPWTLADSMLIALNLFRAMTETWKDEVMKRNLLTGGDAGKVNFLFPSRTGSEIPPGSNAWVVAGAHTRSGKPILASDPHLGFSLPGIWHQVHLRAGELNVAGVAFPGLPGVGIGHNSHIAWGITNLHFDVQDLYLERINLQTGLYEHQGKVERGRVDRESVSVRRSARIDLSVPVTRHGPVVLIEAGHTYSLRWAAAEPGIWAMPITELNRARNWLEFRNALRRFPGPGFNFVYADRQGNIGYQAAGKLPIRRGYEGDIPSDGWTGANEWQGFIPFDELPSVYNPTSGRIITANQNPFPPDYKHPVHGNFASHYRSQQIEAMLSRRKQIEPAGMLAVQRDVYSAFSQFLARELVAACRRKNVTNPAFKDVPEILSEWNGQMQTGTSAPLIVTLAFQHLRKAVVDRASPGKGSTYDLQMAPAVLEQLLRERPGDWFTDYDRLLVQCLADAVEEAKKLQGSDLKRWDYGRYNEILIRQPVVGNAPWVGRYFNLGPVRMSGSQTTVKQTTRRLAPSMRFVADLAAWDKSLLNLMTGQSAQIFSPHRTNHWKTYWAGESFPMQFERVEAVDTLRLEPQ